MLFAIPGRWPSVISVSFQRVCRQSHQNFVLLPWWKLQFCSIHFSETGEGKDKSSNITFGGTSYFLCLSQYTSIYMRWWRMHNTEMYNSAKRPQKLLVWKENSARLQSYVVPIPLWRISIILLFLYGISNSGNEPEKYILEILVHLWRKVTFLGYHNFYRFLSIVIVISGDCLILR